MVHLFRLVHYYGEKGLLTLVSPPVCYIVLLSNQLLFMLSNFFLQFLVIWTRQLDMRHEKEGHEERQHS